MADEMIKLGVLWKNVSRNGNKPYLAGRVQTENLDAAMRLLQAGGRFLVLSNNKRPDKKDPDCNLFVAPEQERPGANHRGQASSGRAANEPNRASYQPRNGRGAPR